MASSRRQVQQVVKEAISALTVKVNRKPAGLGGLH
jgi:hypothetical protein